jgi:hypothetical protein
MVARSVGCLGSLLLATAGVVGGIWVLNLPYPMIRWPVAKTVPIILLPSYISMDNAYRQTISLVEQSDQLVNQATSAQDIELGAEKVADAQNNLDKLPVWFLGYYPKGYCSWFGCNWRFTVDEFETARAEIGRMEAVIFQERNAQDQLQAGTAAVETAQTAFQAAQAGPERSAALANWQRGMDQLAELPPGTLAGRQAATKLQAYQRDYQAISGNVAGGNRSNTLVDAARAFANQASMEGQNPPHSAETWNRIAELWETAIDRLSSIPIDDPGYGEAQTLLAEYQRNLGIVREKAIMEKTSAQALESAKQKNTQLLSQDLNNMPPNQIASRIQAVVDDLNKVQPGTTSYNEARELLKFANQKLAQLQTQS